MSKYSAEHLQKLLVEIKAVIGATKLISKSADVNAEIDADIEKMDAISEIIKQWGERENPQPLTLEQLREMDGKPVWVVINGSCFCAVVSRLNRNDAKEVLFTTGQGFSASSYNKTWTAYAHKPKADTP